MAWTGKLFNDLYRTIFKACTAAMAILYSHMALCVHSIISTGCFFFTCLWIVSSYTLFLCQQPPAMYYIIRSCSLYILFSHSMYSMCLKIYQIVVLRRCLSITTCIKTHSHDSFTVHSSTICGGKCLFYSTYWLCTCGPRIHTAALVMLILSMLVIIAQTTAIIWVKSVNKSTAVVNVLPLQYLYVPF